MTRASTSQEAGESLDSVVAGERTVLCRSSSVAARNSRQPAGAQPQGLGIIEDHVGHQAALLDHLRMLPAEVAGMQCAGIGFPVIDEDELLAQGVLEVGVVVVGCVAVYAGRFAASWRVFVKDREENMSADATKNARLLRLPRVFV
ncbi:MAG: hypothetical protein KBH93_06645 [Anaerolineae bacterium]|nr:hypothetical protein [Anaerolineae bacterium]